MNKRCTLLSNYLLPTELKKHFLLLFEGRGAFVRQIIHQRHKKKTHLQFFNLGRRCWERKFFFRIRWSLVALIVKLFNTAKFREKNSFATSRLDKSVYFRRFLYRNVRELRFCLNQHYSSGYVLRAYVKFKKFNSSN